MKSFPSFRLALWALALIALSLTGVVVASEPEAEQPAADVTEAANDAAVEITHESTEPTPPTTMAIRVEIDPETGQAVIPPPAERRQMVLTPDMLNALNQSSEGLNEVVLPNGIAYVNLQGRFQNLLFATVTEEGAVEIDHDQPEAAQKTAAEEER